jgi:sulfate adenylyltransferase
MREESSLIQPHGGELTHLILRGREREQAIQRAKTLKKIVIDDWAISDLELIANGGFSPLKGFMNQADYKSVLNENRLTNGIVWTIPITLPANKKIASLVKTGEEIALVDKNSEYYALLTIEEIFHYSKKEEAQKTFLTTDKTHPGVAKLYEKPDYYLAGPIKLLNRSPKRENKNYYLDPIKTRAEIKRKGWKTVVGFQTRNPIHRAHEYIQKCALETVDGLFLHPLVGETKKDDVPAHVRIKSYLALLDEYYPKERVLFSLYPAAMRYAGPREAVFHAIVRKNYGCTHFIIGRDHAGVGDYYGPYDAQNIFNKFTREEIGIQTYFFDQTFYCNKCNSMASEKTCPHSASERLLLSGTKVRGMLRKGELPPKEVTRPEIARILAKGMKE